MFVTVTVVVLERVSKEDPVAVIEVHYTFVKNVTLHFILNILTIFHLQRREEGMQHSPV